MKITRADAHQAIREYLEKNIPYELTPDEVEDFADDLTDELVQLGTKASADDVADLLEAFFNDNFAMGGDDQVEHTEALRAELEGIALVEVPYVEDIDEGGDDEEVADDWDDGEFEGD